MRRFVRVKICGVTRPEEALLAAELGAEYLGLNFYPPSPRYLEVSVAAEIAAAVRESARGTKLVGVFVNRPLAEIEDLDESIGLDLLQFHGDEPATSLFPVADRAIKVFRVRDRLEPAVLRGYEDFWGYLFDYRHPDLYGGSGQSWDFSTLDSLRRTHSEKPILIAGGIGPDNVRAVVQESSPWGIDICSGVEDRPGHKDPELLKRLFDEIASLKQGD